MTSSSSDADRRPGGITLIALLLAWLAIAGFGNAFVIPHALPLAVARQFVRGPPDVAAWVLSVAAAAYGLTALAASVGLWRMTSWAPRAFLLWAAAVLLFGGLFAVFIRLPADSPPIVTGALILFLALLLTGLWRYIRRVYALRGSGAL